MAEVQRGTGEFTHSPKLQTLDHILFISNGKQIHRLEIKIY